MDKTEPVTLDTGTVSVRAALQAIEDHFRGQLVFVIRDYGILLTTEDEANARGLRQTTGEGAF